MVQKERIVKKKYTQVSIPTPLADQIRERIEGTGFKTISQYVAYVLEEVLANLEEETKEQGYSKEDEEKVKTRWQEYLLREAEIMKEIELRGDRMH